MVAVPTQDASVKLGVTHVSPMNTHTPDKRTRRVEFRVAAKDGRHAVAERVTEHAAKDAGNDAHQHRDDDRQFHLERVGRAEHAEQTETESVRHHQEPVRHVPHGVVRRHRRDEGRHREPRIEQPEDRRAPEEQIAQGATAEGRDERDRDGADDVHLAVARFEGARERGRDDREIRQQDDEFIEVRGDLVSERARSVESSSLMQRTGVPS